MPVRSMTGFARFEGLADGAGFVWELRSVNGKGLELRLRLPQGFERIEADARRILSSALSRGNLQISLSLDRPENALPAFSINQTFLNEILRLSDELVRAGHATSPSADGLLALRGVIEVTDEAHQPEWFEARGPSVLEGLKAAVAALVAAREQEGEALRTLLVARLNEMEALVGQALEDPSRAPEALAARLRQQVMDLLGADALLDTARLHQEAAVMATKIDIREEIDRLTTHIAAARGLLADGGAIGRKLDFLSQEFNRESNTICSKSHAASLTAIGLQLKVVIDQFREQVQNIE
ncbi:YicC/YloC family endoribonuclease [Aureimonas sp. N4]|uniref:YicC/YloC family endoribonuclease n=1 Tax=Aureimonas sp. N4 TaxID=1638165 RepID=UPI000785EE5A|nr:YicC/YloC family endoribonuclease [Aureimonas sp. N4]